MPTKPKRLVTLRLTILPDSGDAQPVSGGNPNCGAAPPPPPAVTPAVTPVGAGSVVAGVKLVKLFRRAWVRRARARVGRIVCTGRCGQVKLVAKKGRRVIGRGRVSAKGPKAGLLLRLTKRGKRLLAKKRRLKAKVTVWVTPPGGRTVRRQRAVLLIQKVGRKRHQRVDPS